MSLTQNQSRAIEITERVTSVISLLGASIVIITFLSDKSFRKPINRLIFYAAWGNILSNVATVISVTGINLGAQAPLCQFQGFLIQWFLPADALWTFAMACNVYLTFFHNYDAQRLRSLEWTYCILCYGLPLLPAFAYVFIHDESRGRVYGPALLWCWVSLEWDFLRIAVFYGPVWVVIIATLTIYILCGKFIFKWRRQLLSLAQPHTPNVDEIHIVKTTTTEVHFEQVPTSCQGEVLRLTASVSVGQNYEDTTTILPDDVPRHSLDRIRSTYNTNRQKIASASSRAAINYCRTALLFFVALCVIWIPSSINRFYSFLYPERLSFPLAYASGLVLPLQGFWNAVIYISTSSSACNVFVHRAWRSILLRTEHAVDVP